MAADPRQGLGRAGEELAVRHLERRGFTIVERNFRTRAGELDIIGYNGTTLVFCEVKTRRACGSRGHALEAVNPRKRLQVRRIARSWLNACVERPYAPVLRFDAIGVTLDATGRLISLEHVEAAF